MKEALATPMLIESTIEREMLYIETVVKTLKSRDLKFVMTLARGSSDHASYFLSYLFALELGMVPQSMPPSLMNLHGLTNDLKQVLAVSVSQSGESPDLVASMANAKRAGASTLAIVNHRASPLARTSDYFLTMGVGVEKSVAATKTFIASLVLSLKFVGCWKQDEQLKSAMSTLSHSLAKATELPRQSFLHFLGDAPQAVVLSRGLGLAIAEEVALKCIEICRLPAMAYSTSEFKHGPMAMLSLSIPVVVIGVRGCTFASTCLAVKELRELGANVFFIAPDGTDGADLHYPCGQHQHLDSVLAIQAIYPLLIDLALLRGNDPDHPQFLNKVTRTH